MHHRPVILLGAILLFIHYGISSIHFWISILHLGYPKTYKILMDKLNIDNLK